MQKIVAMYYEEPKFPVPEGKSKSASGLIIELEDGTRLQHQTTSVVKPFEPYQENNE